jgi:hypothetical protein
MVKRTIVVRAAPLRVLLVVLSQLLEADDVYSKVHW